MIDFGADSPIVCRPALPMDEEPVLAFVAELFDGDDYVPHVWRDWLTDEAGLLAVAERGGTIVGQGHLADLGWGETWLEGLRVRTDAQGEGVGSHLHDYFIDRWLATAAPVVRLATNVERTAVQRLCERTGFHRLFAFDVANAGPADGPPADGWLLAPISESAGLAEGLPSYLGDSAGLIDLGWRFAEPKAARLEQVEALRLGRIEGRPGQALFCVWPGEAEAQVAAIGAEADDLGDLLLAFRRGMGEADIERVTWLIPSTLDHQLAEAAGFEIEPNHRLYVYERRR